MHERLTQPEVVTKQQFEPEEDQAVHGTQGTLDFAVHAGGYPHAYRHSHFFVEHFPTAAIEPRPERKDRFTDRGFH